MPTLFENLFDLDKRFTTQCTRLDYITTESGEFSLRRTRLTHDIRSLNFKVWFSRNPGWIPVRDWRSDDITDLTGRFLGTLEESSRGVLSKSLLVYWSLLKASTLWIPQRGDHKSELESILIHTTFSLGCLETWKILSSNGSSDSQMEWLSSLQSSRIKNPEFQHRAQLT